MLENTWTCGYHNCNVSGYPFQKIVKDVVLDNHFHILKQKIA